MATLEKIRQRGIFLTIVIGVSLLLFIFTGVDFSSLFGESRTKVAEVNGHELEISEYERRMDEARTFYQIEQGTNSLNEQQSEEVRNVVWNAWLHEQLIGDECEKLGIVVTEEELANQLAGENPHPMLSNLRMLYNPDKGGFDKEILLQLLQAVDADPAGDYAKYWNFVERTIHLQLLEDKYNVLLANSIHFNDVDARSLYDSKKAATVAYVRTPYTSINDTTVTVSNDELKAYYKAHKNDFVQANDECVVKLLAFPIQPSENDYEETEAWIKALQKEFFTSKDFIAVSNQNSDIPFKGIAVSKKTVDPDLKDFAFSAKKDDTFGPVLIGDTYKMARMVETGIKASDSVKVRHILVQDVTAEKTQALADSLVRVINAGADFATLAKEYSLAGTRQNGGELGWVSEGDYDIEFSKACVAAKLNKVFTYPMNGAIQIIQVTEKTQPVQKVKICILSRQVEASSQTYGQIYSNANQYIVKNNDAQSFQDSARADQGMFVRTFTITKENERIGNITDSRQIVRWAFDHNEGDVSDEVFECGNQFVVALVDKNVAKGQRKFATVKEEVKAKIINDKKADIIIENMKQAGDNLAALGTVSTAENVSLSSSFIPTIGREPQVAAVIPALIDSNAVQYAKGSNAVYALKLVALTEQEAFNPAFEIQQLNAKNPFAYMSFEALKKSAKLEDNRIRFY